MFFVLFFTTGLQAQISRQGTPASIEYNIPDVLSSVDVQPTGIDWQTVDAEDQLAMSQNLPVRAGFSLTVDKSIDNDGEWEQLPDGRMMWRLRIETHSAVSVGIVFDMFHLPEGSELYLYNEDKSFIIGAFTSDNNNPNNVFSTHLVPGSTIIIEYIETPSQGFMNGGLNEIMIEGTGTKRKPVATSPSEYESEAILHIGEVIYAYNDKVNEDAMSTRDLGDSGSCQVNINCSPEGDSWQDEKRGVARILFREGAGWYWCSGTLVNNTLENGTPYFLTAYHCGAVASAADHNVWQFYFNYERPGCPNTGTPVTNMITGCVLRAEGDISGGTDMQLVELNSTPPLTWNIYYNGWDYSGNTTPSGVSIHHPAGDAKKISTFSSTTTTTTWWDGTNMGANNGHWTFTSWDATPNGQGVSEGGSSGSPLFNSAGRVIGTLSGGSSDCGGPYSGDLYGRFDMHWVSAYNGSGNAYECRYWLDPAGLDPTVWDGMDPNAVVGPPVTDFSGTPTTIMAGQTVQFSDLTTNLPQDWNWTFSGGFPATSTLRNPTCSWATPGVYTVELTTSNSYGSDTETKVNYITVTPYSAPSSPVTIGTGTNSSYWPYGISTQGLGAYTYVVSASIYQASEIGGGGVITDLAWRPSTAYGDTRNMQIYLKHTSEAQFSTAVPYANLITDAELVYDGTFVPNINGWHNNTLTTPFNYNGGDNLMVIVVVNTTGNPGNDNSDCYYSTSASRHQRWNGSADPTGNGTIDNNRPNIQITITGYSAPVANFGVLPTLLVEDFESGALPTGWQILDE
ncbi:MAG: hypothetical protein C0592_11565, partial [Marinilabiliales bacterium]